MAPLDFQRACSNIPRKETKRGDLPIDKTLNKDRKNPVGTKAKFPWRCRLPITQSGLVQAALNISELKKGSKLGGRAY